MKAMAGDHFEGHDVELVRDRVGAAVARARSGEGPTFIEIDTYRFRGHSMSDPAKYRTRDELEEHKKKDPCLVVRALLGGLGVTEAELDDIDAAVDVETDDCVRFAHEAEPAKEAVMWSTVHSDSIYLPGKGS